MTYLIIFISMSFAIGLTLLAVKLAKESDEASEAYYEQKFLNENYEENAK